MKIELTQNAELRRIKEQQAQRKASWDLFRSTSIVEAVHKARDLGWKDNKVQVRSERVAEDVIEYRIEPFEKGCGCNGILRYDDFFD